MNRTHFKLWDRCRAFVGDVCRGRDSTHGLAHMEQVTEQALLLYSMREQDTAEVPTRESLLCDVTQRNYDAYRIILVGMLHDVADHKYDHDGQLEVRVRGFVEAEGARIIDAADACAARDTADMLSLFTPTAAKQVREGGLPAIVGHITTALDAISYSKENKRGMRWFEGVLPDDWCRVRDFVSDADKLEAIGEAGLVRCFQFSVERQREHRPQDPMPDDATVLKNVAEHFDEKLVRLLPEFIVTPAGKYLGAPRHTEMAETLAKWKADGPPSVSTYW